MENRSKRWKRGRGEEIRKYETGNGREDYYHTWMARANFSTHISLTMSAMASCSCPRLNRKAQKLRHFRRITPKPL